MDGHRPPSFYLLGAWSSPRWLKPLAPLLAVVALGVYVPNNFRLMMFPPAGIYGSNMFDGLIELHQRYPSRQGHSFAQPLPFVIRAAMGQRGVHAADVAAQVTSTRVRALEDAGDAAHVERYSARGGRFDSTRR